MYWWLHTFCFCSIQRRHQGTALISESSVVDEEASSHPTGEESHSKNPREESLIGSLEKIHLSPGSQPDFPQPMPDSSRTPSLQLFTCVQQSQQVSGPSLKSLLTFSCILCWDDNWRKQVQVINRVFYLLFMFCCCFLTNGLKGQQCRNGPARAVIRFYANEHRFGPWLTHRQWILSTFVQRSGSSSGIHLTQQLRQ